MSAESAFRNTSPEGLKAILTVTNKLAAPYDLSTMLSEVVEAAKQVLDAESGSVWLYDEQTDELVLEVAEDMPPIRVPNGVGIVGSCARTRDVINVEDCYRDPRFNRGPDRQTNFRTRCMLTLPLEDFTGGLIGVMQVLNKHVGVFTEDDAELAKALAAQCAVALQRARMMTGMIERERMHKELEMARVVQMSTLPEEMPQVPGYDLYGMFRPAEQTGGDTFDLVELDQGIFILMGDATGHGIAPALSATQMQAMMRVAFRIGADLETAFMHVNNQLMEDLPDDRFVTAFAGFLDRQNHEVVFHSGGQGPILHYCAAEDDAVIHGPTSFPLAAMEIKRKEPPKKLQLAPGDILILLSDGIFEYENNAGEQFGQERVVELVRDDQKLSMMALAAKLLEAVEAFAGENPQEDDMTVVLVKRET